MKKKIYITIIILTTVLLFFVIYLSTIGIKTDQFNSNITSQIKKIEPDLEVRLNNVSAKLNLFKFKINTETIGTELIYRDKIIKIESIKSNISLKSFLNNKFALTEVFISTKSIKVKDLITFIRLLNNDPKIFIAEQFIKKGHVVADLKLEFNETGNVKSNYKINVTVNDSQISLFKGYNLNKINFTLKIDEKNFEFNDIRLSFNNKKILLPKLIASKKNNEYLISGILTNQNTKLIKDDIKNLFRNQLLNVDIYEILFSSKNYFKFKIDKNFKIKDLKINSEIDLEELKLRNPYRLKDFFVKIKKDISFQNQKINLEYKKNDLNITGEGEVFLQNQIDKVKYKISKQKNDVKFDTTLVISNNPFQINLLNYEKKESSDLELNLQGKYTYKEKLIFDKILLKEKNNIISIQNIVLSNDNKIYDIGNITIEYKDKDNFKNNLQLIKKDKDYLISGTSFNIDNIIDRLLNSKDSKKLEIFDKNLKLLFDINKIYLDKNNFITDLKGYLSFDDNEISELNLTSKFTNNKNISLTIKKNGEEKITTLFSEEAKPLVDRFEFIKGFEEGDLDFYSTEKNGITNSTLKIDNFKIQEIPVLAKLLTLASLQGIADLLTGEGIRFTDLEMNFSNQDQLMTIKEMYAIGPAISILLDGYIQRNKLVSIRGTLVPATTVNRTISSIPVIGNILVGKKVGEGVFGVSFKIKGSPKNLETTVNPIKTLTPRFITRTLEKIKKN
jgi:hypothetical protein